MSASIKGRSDAPPARIIDPNSEIVTRALEIISPPDYEAEWGEAEWREDIAKFMKSIPLLASAESELNSTAQKIEAACCVVSKLYPLIQYMRLGDDDQKMIIDLRTIADTLRIAATRALDPPPRGRGRPTEWLKVCAAVAAHTYLSDADKRPTLASDGPFYRLASVLYEGATSSSQKDANLERQCRDVFHLFGENHC